MKVTLYNAVSLDGFIASSDKSIKWTSQEDEKRYIHDAYEVGHIIVGRTTFEEMSGSQNFDIAQVQSYILSSQDSNNPNWGQSPEEIVSILESKNVAEALLFGGGKANAAFLQSQLIDELNLTFHSVILGSGKKLFDSEEAFDVRLEQINEEILAEGVIKRIYKIIY